MNKNTKMGALFVGIWNLFLLILFGTYLIATKRPFEYFIDEETNGMISLAFLILWSAIWFAIGRHISKDIEAKKHFFKEQYPLIGNEEINKIIRNIYFLKLKAMLQMD